MSIKKMLELYLHIPFCVKKCAYCDFLSFSAGEDARRAYVDALCLEINSYRMNYHDAYEVDSIFLGGGTPSILECEQIERIFKALRESFVISPRAEITIEANPGTVTGEKLAAWRMAGINRVSIGLQSVNDEELKLLGRIHTYRQFEETYAAVRGAGFSNVNIDLISAIPGQTAESWRRTLERVAALAPEHISAYSLIIEEGTKFYEWFGEERADVGEENMGEKAGTEARNENAEGKRQGETCGHIMPGLPNEETEREIYYLTKDILSSYGYRRYEISNYAKEGYECRHNLGYWERREYLGIGLGASSLLGHARYKNMSELEKYLKTLEKWGERCMAETAVGEVMEDDAAGNRGERQPWMEGNGKAPWAEENGKLPWIEAVEELTLEDVMAEFMFLGLRKMEGVSEETFFQSFGRKLQEVYQKPLKKLLNHGLLKREGGQIFLTERGIDVSNAVFVEFLEPEYL